MRFGDQGSTCRSRDYNILSVEESSRPLCAILPSYKLPLEVLQPQLYVQWKQSIAKLGICSILSTASKVSLRSYRLVTRHHSRSTLTAAYVSSSYQIPINTIVLMSDVARLREEM
jgi:hypothetical protein